MAQLHFVRGKKNEAAITYYHDGQIREKVNFANDKMDGAYISYYENGHIRERKITGTVSLMANIKFITKPVS